MKKLDLLNLLVLISYFGRGRLSICQLLVLKIKLKKPNHNPEVSPLMEISEGGVNAQLFKRKLLVCCAALRECVGNELLVWRGFCCTKQQGHEKE